MAFDFSFVRKNLLFIGIAAVIVIAVLAVGVYFSGGEGAGYEEKGLSCTIHRKCSDGTGVNHCSAIRPVFCNAQCKLVVRTNECPCLSGTYLSVAGNGCAKATDLTPKYYPEGTWRMYMNDRVRLNNGMSVELAAFTIIRTPLQYFANFFLYDASGRRIPTVLLPSGGEYNQNGLLIHLNAVTFVERRNDNSVDVLVKSVSPTPTPTPTPTPAPTPTCSDGTLTGRCSVTKPYFCSGTSMTMNPVACGCPQGFVLTGENCMPTPTPITKRMVVDVVERSAPVSGARVTASGSACPSSWGTQLTNSAGRTIFSEVSTAGSTFTCNVFATDGTWNGSVVMTGTAGTTSSVTMPLGLP